MPWPPTPPATLALLYDPRFALHCPDGYHPERPARLDAALRGAMSLPPELLSTVAFATREATRQELERVHDPGYLDALEHTMLGPSGFLDSDTYYNSRSREAAWLAAGSACAMVEALLSGETDLGALLCRPPGHHAFRDKPMGFCLINNVAVAAAHARALGVARVAILDWDVHHANGTQDIFFQDPSVLLISLHESPLYPMSGEAREVGRAGAEGTTVNIPLPGATGPEGYARAFERVVLPVLDAFEPALLLLSAGYDSHARDPLASMQLDAPAYAWMASKLRQCALRHGRGRVGLVLEGGYDLSALEASVAATLRGLALAEDFARPTGVEGAEVDRALSTVLQAQQPYWPTLGSTADPSG